MSSGGPSADVHRHLADVVHRMADAVTVLDRHGRRVYANAAAASILGIEVGDEPLGPDRDPLLERYDLLTEAGEPFELDQLPGRRALCGEEAPEDVVVHVDRRTGERRWMIVKSVPIRDESGEIVFAASLAEDVTAVKRAERHQAMLSQASKLIASSLNLEVTLEKVAYALIPELGDWCAVHLPDEHGRLHVAATAGAPTGDQAAPERPGSGFSPPPDERSGPWAVLRSGQPQLVREIDEAFLRHYASSEEHLEALRAIGYRSSIVVPMVARGAAIGTISLITSAQSGRRLDESDVEVVEELGRRAGAAVENARTHGMRSHIASTLQRSLLPPRLPVVPGLELAARFRAAGEGTEVGGDFYDLFPAADGTWMVIMGDVTGKGPAAAAITGLARYTMRTAAAYESSPEAILHRLNETLIADSSSRRLCTAVCARIEPLAAGVRVTVACAGHPPPLTLTGGAPEPVGRPGTLLGAFEQGHWEEAAVELAADEGLVLYTDGVTDAKGPEGRFGFSRLVRLLGEVGDGEPERVAGDVDRAVLEFQEGPQRDDVALLVLRAAPGVEGVSAIVGQAPSSQRAGSSTGLG